MTGVSWRPGCPVPLERLRRVTLSHWDFAGKARSGVLIVRDDVAEEVVMVFGQLFRERFPIRRIRPVDEYDGDDFTSIEADNTSAFNCRAATGSSEWSHHAYGLAIDLNPLENPYVLDGRTSHTARCPTSTGIACDGAWSSTEIRCCARSRRPGGTGAATGATPSTTSTSRSSRRTEPGRAQA